MNYFKKGDEIFAFDEDQLELVTDEMVQIDEQEVAALLLPSKETLQAQVWEQIKQKRHANTEPHPKS